MQHQIKRDDAVTKDNKAVTVTLALNYGGRDELVHAVKAIAKEVQNGKTNPDSIDEETVSRHLYTYDMPDPDLVIRTSGELRLSNYLLWQTSYSELYFTDTLWPDFDEKEFTKAIDAYLSRNRRFGGR